MRNRTANPFRLARAARAHRAGLYGLPHGGRSTGGERAAMTGSTRHRRRVDVVRTPSPFDRRGPSACGEVRRHRDAGGSRTQGGHRHHCGARIERDLVRPSDGSTDRDNAKVLHTKIGDRAPRLRAGRAPRSDRSLPGDSASGARGRKLTVDRPACETSRDTASASMLPHRDHRSGPLPLLVKRGKGAEMPNFAVRARHHLGSRDADWRRPPRRPLTETETTALERAGCDFRRGDAGRRLWRDHRGDPARHARAHREEAGVPAEDRLAALRGQMDEIFDLGRAHLVRHGRSGCEDRELADGSRYRADPDHHGDGSRGAGGRMKANSKTLGLLDGDDLVSGPGQRSVAGRVLRQVYPAIHRRRVPRRNHDRLED